MKKIRLMPDYQCYPLWEYENDELVQNRAPNSLPLSKTTIARLEKWSEDYDAILNWNDPISSCFPSQEHEKAFIIEGFKLWRKLREELGQYYDEITYFNCEINKIVKHESDFPLAEFN